MQLLDLTLPAGLGIMANAGIKGPRRLLHKLLLPSVNLVRVNLVAHRKVRNRRLLPQRLQGNPRLQRRINLPSRSLAHLPLRSLPTERPRLQLVNWSQNRGPLHATLGSFFRKHASPTNSSTARHKNMPS